MQRAPRPPRRITPGLLDFYIKRAHQMREELWREMWRGLWAVLKRRRQR